MVRKEMGKLDTDAMDSERADIYTLSVVVCRGVRSINAAHHLGRAVRRRRGGRRWLAAAEPRYQPAYSQTNDSSQAVAMAEGSSC